MRPKHFILLVLLSAYVNIIVYGFEYGTGNHTIQLAMVNWLRDPSLYPNDPITDFFARYPSHFWRLAAYVSAWIDPLPFLFLAFLVTKVLFFAALVRLAATYLHGDVLTVAGLAFAVALSPMLNHMTPLAYSDVLNAVQTHTSLAIALLLWVGVLLVEGHWLAAAVLLGCTTYVNALFVAYTLAPFAAFALLDFRRQHRQILLALLIIGILALPGLILWHGETSLSFPAAYVERMHYTYHVVLRNHSAYDFLRGGGVLAVAVGMVAAAAKLGIPRHGRLELLVGVFFAPVLLGALVGDLFPVPSLMRLQFLRADSFLLLYAVILVQLYGAKALLSPPRDSSLAVLVLGAAALLFPLALPAPGGDVLLILLPMGLLFIVHPLATFAVATGCTLARIVGLTWMPVRAVAIMVIAGGVGTYLARSGFQLHDRRWRVPVACGVIVLSVMGSAIPHPSRLWNPQVAASPLDAAWRQVQQWAKAHTPRDAKFLVPPALAGFRVFSERSSWVDWKDYNISYVIPSYIEEWRRRLEALGVHLVPGQFSSRLMAQEYKKQSWEHLLSVAEEHRLHYIIQYADVPYDIPPVFRNESFAIYHVPR